MKTHIILKDEWQLLLEYPFLFTMSKGDQIELNDIEYKVMSCFLEVENQTMIILVH